MDIAPSAPITIPDQTPAVPLAPSPPAPAPPVIDVDVHVALLQKRIDQLMLANSGLLTLVKDLQAKLTAAPAIPLDAAGIKAAVEAHPLDALSALYHAGQQIRDLVNARWSTGK